MDLIRLTVAETRSPLLSRYGSLMFIVLGTALIWIGAKISVPLYPVPMTLQTLAVLGLAVAYGERHAAASFGLYLMLGAAGLPVFTGSPEKGIGLAYMLGPTGGYLVGMLAACGVTGLLSRRAGPLRRVAAMLAGTATILACGALWLTHIVGSLDLAVQVGVLRFLPGEFVKVALLTALAAAGDELLARKRPGTRATRR